MPPGGMKRQTSKNAATSVHDSTNIVIEDDHDDDIELLDEEARVRAITPIMTRQISTSSRLGNWTEEPKLETNVSRRLKKYAERRQQRAHRGFFIRDKKLEMEEEEEEEPEDEDDGAHIEAIRDRFDELLYIATTGILPRTDGVGQRVTLGFGLFQCELCPKESREVFMSVFEREFHQIIAHHKPMVVQCTEEGCSENLEIRQYVKHVDIDHNKCVEFPCLAGCCEGVQVNSLDQWWQHLAKSSGAIKYVCPVCLNDYMTTNPQNLAKHIQNQHNSDRINVAIVARTATKSHKISQNRAEGVTIKCVLCVKDRCVLTPCMLFENALSHLRSYHQNHGMICLDCKMIRDVDDRSHWRRCLLSTDEGMSLKKNFQDGQVAQALQDAVSAEIMTATSEQVSMNRTQGTEDDILFMGNETPPLETSPNRFQRRSSSLKVVSPSAW